jgi:hypothetical protein
MFSVCPKSPQRGDAADHGQRLRQHDDGGLQEGVELAGEHHVEQHQRQAEGEHHVLLRLAEFLGLADELDLVAGRQDFGGAAHLGDGVAERDGRRGVEGRRVLQVEAADHRRAELLLEAGHGIEAHQLAVAAAQEDLRQVGRLGELAFLALTRMS